MRLQTLRTPLLAGLTVLVLAFALAGCGSDDNTTNTSSTDSAMGSNTASEDSMNSSEGVMVGGAAMLPSRDIVDNAVKADNVTTLVSLVKQAELVDTLKGKGPFTVFAPTNDAFAAVDPATVKSLQEPKNKKTLQKVLTYHVLAGKYDAAKLMKIAGEGGSVTTVEGGKLTPEVKDGKVVIKDANGGTVTVETADVISSNGVTHVVDGVLMP